MKEKCTIHSHPEDDCLECQRRATIKAQHLVQPAPGLASHLAEWTMEEGRPMLRGLVWAGEDHMPTEEAAYDFAAAAEIAGRVAGEAANLVAKRLEEREQRIAFATVFTKVFDRAFDAALAEIVNEELRQRRTA